MAIFSRLCFKMARTQQICALLVCGNGRLSKHAAHFWQWPPNSKRHRVHAHLITPEVYPDPISLNAPRSAKARLQAQTHLRYNLIRALQRNGKSTGETPKWKSMRSRLPCDWYSVSSPGALLLAQLPPAQSDGLNSHAHGAMRIWVGGQLVQGSSLEMHCLAPFDLHTDLSVRSKKSP